MLRGLLCYTLFSEFLRELSTTYSFLTEKSVPQNFSFCDTPFYSSKATPHNVSFGKQHCVKMQITVENPHIFYPRVH